MVEGAPLLREYTSKAYRGFESHPLRHQTIPKIDSKNSLTLPALYNLDREHRFDPVPGGYRFRERVLGEKLLQVERRIGK